MVIQPNMSSKAIVEVWENTIEILNTYNVPISEKTLEVLVQQDILPTLLMELNTNVGSSSVTCIEGG
ncbi:MULTISPECIES: hypothetical protein [unclassified Bacillus (in: firmicutes)]|uniref:hypothetical protein n=1 Tax=unclassified Bacillus (in: firmicutes) TaxID=185979 RepID=UPI000E3ED617|nr:MULTISPECIES: hypothetical protein [unclassified Bacillus (in: firmicutes)]RFU69572.1 hypothetical protein D0463_01690 [Bacillus sp. V59.32b]CAH0343806.1 hypothetical protein BCI9360_00031 [Bacillus sp. CECT 9360]